MSASQEEQGHGQPETSAEDAAESEVELSLGLKLIAAELEARRAKEKQKDAIKQAASMAETFYQQQAAAAEEERRQLNAAKQLHIESLQKTLSVASVQVLGALLYSTCTAYTDNIMSDFQTCSHFLA
jgi:hypothetical protein